jgi:hypothetical protein
MVIIVIEMDEWSQYLKVYLGNSLVRRGVASFKLARDSSKDSISNSIDGIVGIRRFRKTTQDERIATLIGYAFAGHLCTMSDLLSGKLTGVEYRGGGLSDFIDESVQLMKYKEISTYEALKTFEEETQTKYWDVRYIER